MDHIQQGTSVSVAGIEFGKARRVRLARISPVTAVSLVFLGLILLSALFPELVTGLDPFETNAKLKLAPPSLAHPFGTDSLGRDQFARFVWGTSRTLSTAGAALVVAFSVSAVLGLVSGYLGGLIDEIVMRVTDVLLAVPSLLIALMLVTGLGFGVWNIAIAVGFSSVAAFTRVMRAEVLRVRAQDFVTSSRHFGLGWVFIISRHIFPHTIRPIFALTALEFGGAILAVASLSFLGFGAPPPAPEWGSLIADGRANLARAWWLTNMPGLALIGVVLATNHLGRFIEPKGGVI